jgi:hypothetical protein
MTRRFKEKTPPPAPEQIRRELGWEMLEAERACMKLTNRGKP